MIRPTTLALSLNPAAVLLYSDLKVQAPNSVLLATLPIEYGKGVATHTSFVLQWLRSSGYSVTVAYYQPYSMAPSLSVPSWRLGRNVVQERTRTIAGIEAHEIGCWLPELEFTNYWPTRAWKDLIARHAVLLAVTGNALAATPFAMSGRPYLAWLGTPFDADRRDRIKKFPIIRRVLDRSINSPMCRYCERLVLNSGLILPTTPYVEREFRAISPAARVLSPVPVPVDTGFFYPAGGAEPLSLTFIGKYNDPRKNIRLLLDVVRSCRARGVQANLRLYGDTPSKTVRDEIRDMGLEGAVHGLRSISRDELREIYRSSAVFVIPSHQEGLCVAGLEAMACGCPVVTSPCGGPVDYVRDGWNGYVVPLTTGAFTAAVLRIMQSADERRRLSLEARATIEGRYAAPVVEAAFQSAFAMLAGNSRRLPNQARPGTSPSDLGERPESRIEE